MSIRNKLYAGFGAILAVVLVLFLVNMAAMLRERSARSAATKSADMEQATEAVRFQMMENRLLLGNYLLSGDTRELDHMNAGVSRLTGLLDHATSLAVSDQERAALGKVKEAEQNWATAFAGSMISKRKDVDAGNATVAELQIFYLQQNPTEWLRKSSEPLDEVNQATVTTRDKQQKLNETASIVTLVVSILGTLLAIMCGAGVAFFTARSISTPLSHLIGVARQIGDSGDLNQSVDITRNDEIGELARTFDKMVTYLKEMSAVSEAIAGGNLGLDVKPRSDKDTLALAFSSMISGLRKLVTSVRDSASQVASGSNQVAGASEESAKVSIQASQAIDEVTSTMHEMSINVQNMVKNTQVQASSVSETSASIDQMVASIQRVADTAKVLLDISQRSREEVQSGITTMDKATQGLSKINDSIHTSSDIIGVLGQRADDIGKIIEVIDDLAEQTNLLALNAAIEAARAGEHGLGFAVVADEVRKLAEKSAQSTKEISDLIRSIQTESRKAVDNMEKSTTIVNDGLTLGTDLSTALKKISNVVTEVYKFAQEIGAATNEQSHGSSQIAKATTRLNEITHEINSSVEEQASGAQAVVKAMERMRELTQQSTSSSTELAASAEQMSKMARSLLEAMDRFALESAGSGSNGHGRSASTPAPFGEEHTRAAHYAAAARS